MNNRLETISIDGLHLLMSYYKTIAGRAQTPLLVRRAAIQSCWRVTAEYIARRDYDPSKSPLAITAGRRVRTTFIASTPRVARGSDLITYRPSICIECGSRNMTTQDDKLRVCSDCGYTWRIVTTRQSRASYIAGIRRFRKKGNDNDRA